ncbi:hypothetical protein EIN_492120 [Entamoeba invadens IP1]|uniref:DUF1846 domain-containing protein n=1 Tax=Entamoeba invadens IP1 TaxID=370355 RepID=A0A0A1U415_ENTIV|nr:hypothetical protein EIN_492120 [Entamoeba invadens IP1]ELP88983.1 hypothetical protein EIN_492120 [Entamoeba invadens IP1]|eukprot:XP_004255754.1 hypothetical protein EIN_492120 [Entamoeba invadens IP1]
METAQKRFMKPIGFDTEKYLHLQKETILERAKMFNNKLYIEFGGKLLNDSHAVRVLPGYQYNVKVEVLKQIKDNCEVIMCINASDIGSKRRHDVQLFYEEELFLEIDELQAQGLSVVGVVITQYIEAKSVLQFIRRCKNSNIKTYIHHIIEGYPTDFPRVVSEEGFGKNDFVITTKPVIVVTAPGPNSGKMATCLSQLYHELKKNNIQAGYAKFESFPVWNLPLKHPVNVAYEAATADLRDMNMIDHYYLETTGKVAVSYNRDMETYALLKVLLELIYHKTVYNSPTEMGVNRIGFAILNDDLVQQAAKNEIVRRYMLAVLDEKMGLSKKEEVLRLNSIMKDMNMNEESRIVVVEARKEAERIKRTVACVVLHDGSVIIGREGNLMTASSAVVMNALKYVAEIPENIKLLSPTVIDSILGLNTKFEKRTNTKIRMSIHETLIALGVGSASNPTAGVALDMTDYLDGCEFHVTHRLAVDETNTLVKMGLLVTSDY